MDRELVQWGAVARFAGSSKLAHLTWGLLAEPRCTPGFMLTPASQVQNNYLELPGVCSQSLAAPQAFLLTPASQVQNNYLELPGVCSQSLAAPQALC
jgi:hypothetical protein